MESSVVYDLQYECADLKWISALQTISSIENSHGQSSEAMGFQVRDGPQGALRGSVCCAAV